MTEEIYYPPINSPDTQRFMGQAFLKREGYITDTITGEAWRADMVEVIAKAIMEHSRYKRVTDAMRETAIEVISAYEKKRRACG